MNSQSASLPADWLFFLNAEKYRYLMLLELWYDKIIYIRQRGLLLQAEKTF